MTPPASSTTEPPVFELGTLEIPPAAGLEQNEVLPFSIANFKKAVTDRLRAHDGGDDTQLWIVFSGFDYSKLKYIDQLRYPIRLQLDDSKLIMKMVDPVHKMMHRGLIQYLVKSVRSEATPKITPPAKTLCKSHIINSRALKKSEATYRNVI
jgi:hypothetical protein